VFSVDKRTVLGGAKMALLKECERFWCPLAINIALLKECERFGVRWL
jgi:hypothetical protein